MRIGIHDSDQTTFPNLALMKLSAHHKNSGDSVEWFNPLFGQYDKIYSSKVFTFTPEYKYFPSGTELIKGGTGYDNGVILSSEIEHLCPDYDLYDNDFSMGFVTRGCCRDCSWCFVREKEGVIKKNCDFTEFTRHKELVLMDNNILAHRHGIEQLEKISKAGIKLDCNQGVDARLINTGVAKIFSKIKWRKPVRLACDTADQMASIQKAVSLMRWHNVTPRKYFCYVLVDDVAEAREIIYFLKGLDIDPHCQPLRDKLNTPPTDDQKRFARWVNMKASYNSTTWEDYR